MAVYRWNRLNGSSSRPKKSSFGPLLGIFPVVTLVQVVPPSVDLYTPVLPCRPLTDSSTRETYTVFPAGSVGSTRTWEMARRSKALFGPFDTVQVAPPLIDLRSPRP